MFVLNSVRVAPGVRSALAVACGLALVLADDAWSADAVVDTVVVTANREPQSIRKVLADVSVVTRDDIERQGSCAAVDLVKFLPGFEIARNGGPATISSVFVRGAESRHMLVMIDGVRVDTQSGSGGASWEAIPASQIDHIEVVRGPASAIYGSDAMAGVVQIFTRAGQGPAKLDLGLGLGSLGQVSMDGQLAGSVGGLSYSVGLASERASGFNAQTNTVAGTRADDDDGYRSGSASARLGYQFSDQHKVNASLLSQHINGQYDASVKSTKDDRAIHDLDAVSATWVAQWLDAWRSTVTLGQSTDRYETRPSVYITETQVQNASWANQVKLGEHTVRATLEGREDKLLNSTLTTSPTQGKGTTRDGALGLGYDWQQGPLSLQSSVREDHYSDAGQHVTGSVAGGYDFAKAWRVRASWGTAFRTATLYERYSDYGQAGLQPEASRTGEVGLQYTSGSTQWGITYFDSHVTNLIQYGAKGVCKSTFGCYRNVSSAELEGLELSGAVSLAAVRLSGSFNLDAPKNTDTDLLLRRRSRQHGSVRAETTVAQWTVGTQVLASGKRYDDDSNLKKLGGYAIWGVDAQTQLAPNWKLILRADNLTDKYYQTAVNYATSPRTVFVGVRWTPSL
jgi:vitamin B12 transporter